MNTYILLPAVGFRSDALRDLGETVRDISGPKRLSVAPYGSGDRGSDIDVVDRVSADGPMVARMSSDVARRLRNDSPDVVVAPVRSYRQALSPMRTVSTRGVFDGAEARTSVRISFVVEGRGIPLEGAAVVAVLDRHRGLGLPRRHTSSKGKVTLTFPTPSTRLEELFVYPRHGCWGLYLKDVTLRDGDVLEAKPIDFGQNDFLQEMIPTSNAAAGQGVRVGIVDSGVDPKHRDLTIFGGANFAADGGPGDWRAGSDGHGTHVAGIIGGQAKAGEGMRGIAPACELYSYRVFPKNGGTTSTTAIMKALNQAVEDRCDIVNLSLGGGLPDPALNRAIGDAYDRGVVCVVAAGNDGRKDVAYPAWYKRAVAVSALGREGTFPDGSLEGAQIEGPRSQTFADRFIALFSNIGYEIDFAAPGVGIVSCFPDNRYAVMSGTSMACPAVAGVAAALLSSDADVLAAPRDRDRARRIAELVRMNALDLGFARFFQGFGLPVVNPQPLS